MKRKVEGGRSGCGLRLGLWLTGHRKVEVERGIGRRDSDELHGRESIAMRPPLRADTIHSYIKDEKVVQ